MIEYAILQHPGHNRVFYEAAKKLSLNELHIASKKISATVLQITSREIGGVHYFIMECEYALTSDDIALISRLSPTYALFQIVNMDETAYLQPIEKKGFYYFGDELNTILKYSGKTNETFTRMMINAAVLASDFSWDTPLKLLDPLCGKGTTLYDALILGYNAYGIDINEKMLHETCVFFKKYLENGRYKHVYTTEKAATEDKRYMTDRNRFSMARSKTDLKNNRALCLELLMGDCANADKYFKKQSMHLIVGDLPYGIQHGGRSNETKMLSRSPLALLESALPAWHRILKPGGAMALAYNRFVVKTDEIIKVMHENCFLPVLDEGFNSFSHRVDQAIMRDIIVCRVKSL